MSENLIKKELFDLIEFTAESLNLKDPSVIEKDYYGTQAICILSSLKNELFHLVFAGGTCLAKAHRLVKRMSEDIDFKIQKNAELCKGFSKSKYLKELKNFREAILKALENTIFRFNEVAVRNEGQYLRIKLDYPSQFLPNSALRSNILLEFTVSEIRLDTEDLQVTTIIQDVLTIPFKLSTCLSNCISVEETAAEKWVGLTRRISGIERGYFPEDQTLVRHIYDLSAINVANKIKESFFSITKDIVVNDGQQFKNQYPEYFNQPFEEINRSLNQLRNNTIWEKHYFNFIDTMVYDKNALKYKESLPFLESLSVKAIATMKNNINYAYN